MKISLNAVLLAGAAALACGCTAPAPGPANVSWSYGTGAGEGSKYMGAAPQYSRAYGMGAGEGVKSAAPVTTNYAWGADGQSGNMIQTSTPSPQYLAAPATPAPAPIGPSAPGNHS